MPEQWQLNPTKGRIPCSYGCGVSQWAGLEGWGKRMGYGSKPEPFKEKREKRDSKRLYGQPNGTVQTVSSGFFFFPTPTEELKK